MNKMNIFLKLPILFLFTILLFTSCEDDIVPGQVVQDTRFVPEFDAIEVGHGFDVILATGQPEQLVVEAPEGYQPYIYTTVSNNRLVVDIDRSIQSSNIDTKKIYLTVGSLNKIILSGNTQLISSSAINEENLEIELSGASEIQIEVDAVSTEVNLSGASLANITGSTESLNLSSISGASTFEGFELMAQDVNVSASGASRVYVYAEEELDVTASGGSIVEYKGDPSVQSNVSGGSEVKEAN